MDSGLGSDEERRGRTKEQKQRHNQQLLSGCFLGATTTDDGGDGDGHHRHEDQRRSRERRQGALLFQTSIQQYSTVHMPDISPPDTPYNSIVQIEDAPTSQQQQPEERHRAPLGFYVDLSEVEDPEPPPPPPSTSSTKKNIFSMVIDFQAPKKDMPNRLRRNRINSAASSNGDHHSTDDIKEICESTKTSIADLSNLNLISFNTNGNSSNSNKNSSNSDGNLAYVNCDSACAVVVDDDRAKDVAGVVRNCNEALKHSNSIEAESKQFVKLSDLERQSPIIDLPVLPRMTRSIPESSWVEEPLLMSRSMGYRSTPRAPLPPDPFETLSDSSGSEAGGCRRRLGTDLLKMFLEEIGPDVRVKVAGRVINAHRCILVSRCQYFAGSLSGHHEDVINLRGFSYETVHFAMCHIYSGASRVPDSISLDELAALADLLGLEGLKEVVAHSLKSRHCHNFHKPCPGCLTGVPEVLPLAAAHGLDELYQKCLRWLTQHYERTWPTRAFVSMPKELREKCLQQHVVHMAADNVLDTIFSCDRLLGNLPQVSWCDPVVQLAVQLADSCQLYLRQHLAAVLAAPAFLNLNAESLQRLEEQILSAAEALTPEQACRCYGRCHKMLDQNYSRDHVNLLRKLGKQLEQSLAARADKATRCPAWQKLEPALRARVREAARPSRVPRASSSDSSRTSSPATSRAPAGSPSLRRSLLLAARTPQVPPSPATARKVISSLTKPTQSSAAKSNPSKNLKDNVKDKPKPTKREPVQPCKPRTPVVARRTRDDVKSPNVSKSPSKTTVYRSPSKTNVCKSPSKTNVCKSPSKTNVHKSPSKANVSKSPSKSYTVNTAKSGNSKAKSPSKSIPSGMTRSGTFLMDEPTVLGRAH